MIRLSLRLTTSKRNPWKLKTWPVLGIITGLGIAGSFAGTRIAKRVPQDRLKRWFGYFLIVMGIYILARSLPAVIQTV